MYQQRWVHRYYDKDVEAQRIAIALDWGGITIERQFNMAIVENEKNYIAKKLFPLFLEFISKVMKDFSESQSTEKWYPKKV